MKTKQIALLVGLGFSALILIYASDTITSLFRDKYDLYTNNAKPQIHDSDVFDDAEAQAQYDLQHHKAKLYIYGLVFEDEMKTRYKNHEVQLVYRGCMIGGTDYKREMRYNRVVKKALGLPLDELDLEKI
jgi:hypothetical protein